MIRFAVPIINPNKRTTVEFNIVLQAKRAEIIVVFHHARCLGHLGAVERHTGAKGGGQLFFAIYGHRKVLYVFGEYLIKVE